MFEIKRRKFTIYVLQKKCISCENCIDICRRNVFSMFYKNDDSYAVLEHLDRCTGCGRCEKLCPVNAIEIIRE